MVIEDALGQIIELKVARETDFGYFLTDGEEDVLLHKNEAVSEYEIDDNVKVFLYSDAHNRIAATSILPSITVGTYGWAEVTDVDFGIGVFINIGIQKEILLGKDDLPKLTKVWPQVGDILYITLRVSKNNLIYARLATDPIFKEKMVSASREDFNDPIAGVIYRTSKVGSWIFSSKNYMGFIHNSERNVEPRLGEEVSGRIIAVHEDGSVNVSLLPRIEEALDDDAAKIYAYLIDRKGAMPYSDKSLPEDIAKRFNISKGAFKRALGRLMKEGKVYQEDGWTYAKNLNDNK